MMRPSKPWSRPCSARSSIGDSSAIACAVCLRLAATRLSRRGGAVTSPAAELSFYFRGRGAARACARPAFTERVVRRTPNRGPATPTVQSAKHSSGCGPAEGDRAAATALVIEASLVGGAAACCIVFSVLAWVA